MYNVNRDRLIGTFVDLVKIPSPSWNEAKVLEYITRNLKSLGIGAEKVKCGQSYNLLARLPGTQPRPVICFSCHMDTVTPCEGVRPVVGKTKITSDGSTILGADDKAAVAAFLEAMRVLKEEGAEHGPIELLFSCAEEVGLQGIKGFDLSMLAARYAFVFDSGGEIGRVILKAPYHMKMDVTVSGKSAHAGMEPEKGISAIRVLSEIITRIPHGRIDEESTVNVGVIQGGRATNIVAEEAMMKLEGRSLSLKKLRDIEDDIRLIIKSTVKERGGRAGIKRMMAYEGFSIRESDRIVKIVTSALGRIGIAPKFETSGGGSDTNILNKAGIRAINLSIGMRNVHSRKEYIEIRDLVNGARLVRALVDCV